MHDCLLPAEPRPRRYPGPGVDMSCVVVKPVTYLCFSFLREELVTKTALSAAVGENL